MYRKKLTYKTKAKKSVKFVQRLDVSVRPSHSCIVSKRLNVSSQFYPRLVAASFHFMRTKLRYEIPMGSLYKKTCGVAKFDDIGLHWVLATHDDHVINNVHHVLYNARIKLPVSLSAQYNTLQNNNLLLFDVSRKQSNCMFTLKMTYCTVHTHHLRRRWLWHDIIQWLHTLCTHVVCLVSASWWVSHSSRCHAK